MRRSRLPLPALLSLALLTAAAPADASTAAFNGDRLRVTAAPGESNDITVGISASTGVTVTDAGAPLTALETCTAVDAHRARCPLGSALYLSVDLRLGDGDDSARVTVDAPIDAPEVRVDGGSGADAIDVSGVAPADQRESGDCLCVQGGPGDDRIVGAGARNAGAPQDLYGDAGDDVIVGGAGVDSLFGGPGRDTLKGGAGEDGLDGGTGSDTLDGGAGRDVAVYLDHRHGVHVDLRKGREAGVGEHDSLTSVEDVTGTSYRDVLLGDDGRNVLSGSPDASPEEEQTGDVLVGRGGNDVLFARDARTASGGAGDDQVTIYDPRPGTVSCGTGRDVTNTRQLVPADCESVATSFSVPTVLYGRPRVQGHHAVLRVRRVFANYRGRIALGSPGGRRYGSASVTRSGLVRIALSPTGRAAAARHAIVRVDLAARGIRPTFWTLRL